MEGIKQNDALGTEKIGRLFLKLSIPAVVAQIINVLYNVIDRMYIGHIPEIGGVALTGVGVTFPIIIFISAFTNLCSMGGAPKAAICLGEKNPQKANKILGNCVFLTAVVSVVLTTVVLVFGRKLLLLFGGSETTVTYALDYLNIYAIGTPFVMVSLGLNMFITTQGFSRTSMLTVIIGAVCNIALDPLFIFAFNMGVKGAALATVISQGVSAVFVVAFLLSKRSVLKITWKSLLPDLKIILSCVALGVSPFIMQSTESVLSICFNTSLRGYEGDVAVGAMTILSSIMQFVMLPLQGFTHGAQPIISYNYGAQNPRRCKQAFKILFITCLTYSATFWVLLMALPSVVVRIFTDDAQIVQYTVWAARIYMAAIGIFGIQIACQQTFIALGKAAVSLFLAVLRKIILLIPLIYIIPLLTQNKAMGVFLAEPVADALAVLTTAITFFVVFRKTMRTISLPQVEQSVTAPETEPQNLQ